MALSLSAYGTIRLLEAGAGGGQGPEPIAAPPHASHALQVQVIAQQWQFTYRWPSFGGVQTRELELPAHTLVQFNVTSLDVIHSFWAYQLGVKADANPGVNNVAYVTTDGPGPASRSAAPSSAASGTATCTTTGASSRARASSSGSRSSDSVRARDAAPSALLEDLLPEPAEEGRMSSAMPHLPPLRAGQAAALAAADRLQRAHRRRARHRRLLPRLVDRPPDHTSDSFAYLADAGENDIALLLGYVLGVIGFLIGLGFAIYPIQRLLGRADARCARTRNEGIGRYFGLSTDHKVVGMQYLVGIGFFFFVGGLNAMLIRTELLQPDNHVFGANQYLTLVGMHGTMMMGILTSGILGPFANYFVPIMIGARRMAFPRIESLTFWLLMAAGCRPHHDDLLRRLSDRLDRLPATRRPGRTVMTPTSASSRWSGSR